MILNQDEEARLRQCLRKKLYPDAILAERGAVEMQRRTQNTFDAYNCQWCNGWHVGRRRTVKQGYARAVRQGRA